MNCVGLIVRTMIILLDTSLVHCNFVSVTVTCFCLFFNRNICGLIKMVREKKGKGKCSRTAGKSPSKEIPQEAPQMKNNPDPAKNHPQRSSKKQKVRPLICHSHCHKIHSAPSPHVREGKGKKLPPIEFPDYVLDKFFNFVEKSKILWSNDKEYAFNKKQRKEEAWKELQALLIRTFPQRDPDMKK